MSKVWNLVKSWKGINPTDSLEFMQKSSKLREIKSGMSKDEKQKIFAEFIDSLSDNCFYSYGQSLLMTIKPTEENSKNYDNAEGEVQGFLAWCPRYELFREDITKMIKEHREKYKLPI